jgi:hypothetical protein
MAGRGVRALRLAYKLRRELAQRFAKPKTVYVWNRVPYYRQLWEEACQLCGYTLVELKPDTWEVQDEGRPVTRINNCYLELDNPVTLNTAGDKRVTYELLAREGLPMAPHAVFTLDDFEPMKAFVREHPGPFVIKPGYGTGSGIGVTTYLTDPAALKRAAVLASLHCPELLVEQHVPGEVYRLLHLGDRIIAASRRRGLWLTGDGERTVRSLYLAACPDGVDADGWLADPDFRTTTALQDIGEESVPAPGERLLVRSVARPTESTTEVRTVYDEDALASLSPAILDEAERAARALRSEFCGVDIITTDPDRSLTESGGVIGEVNTTPGLHHHYRLDQEDAPHIGERVLRYLVAKRGFDTAV